MDWDGIIERNAERLVAVLTELFAMAGFGRGGTALLPRHVCRAVLMLLRPAESALRRLIVMAARGIVVKLKGGGASRAFPKGTAFERDADRVAAFCLIDPLKRFGPAWFEDEEAELQTAPQVIPRISVPGFIDPVFPPAKPVPAFRPIPGSDDLISPSALRRRLIALRHALDNLPRQALRLARWRARRALGKIRRRSPFRPGFAPGYHRHKPREIDLLLADCHHFAHEAWYADSS